MQQFNPIYENLSASTGQLKETTHKLLESTRGNSDSAFTLKAALALCLFIIGATFVLVYSRLLGNVTTRSVRETQEILEAISRGEIPDVRDSGARDEFGAMQNSLRKLVINLNSIKSFVLMIGRSEFDIKEEVFENNGDLSNALWQMRDNLIKIKDEEQKTRWTSEGLAQFSELVRTYQHRVEDLANHSIRFLCKYINAQQGSFFTKQKVNSDEYLTLIASFAFDKKKYLEKQIPISDGVLGQEYLEADTVLLRDIRQGYLHIASGLGYANPTCLAIVPLKFNGVVEGVIEVATFRNMESFEIKFLERCGEFLASALQMATISATTKKLLEQSQQQAEELKAQEEEVRQNMEELQATQEHLLRRETEQAEEINKRLNADHERNAARFKRLSLVADNTDNGVMITNLQNVIEYVNEGYLKQTGFTLQELIGKNADLLSGSLTSKETIQRIIEKLKANEPANEEISYYNNKSGKESWANIMINSVFENDELKGYITIQSDITNAKLLSLEFNAQLDAIGRNNAVIEFTLDGKITHANEVFLGVMGYAMEHIKHKYHKILVDTNYADSNDYKTFWRELANGQSQTGEFKRIGKGGKVVWLSANYAPIKNINGDVYKAIKFARDITQQKLEAIEVEIQRQAVNKTYSVAEFDPHGLILTGNENFLQLMEYELAEIKGRHHRIFVQQEESCSADYRSFWDVLSGGESVQGRFSRVSKSGKVIQLQGTYFRVKDLAGKIYKIVKFAQQTDRKQRSDMGEWQI